MTASDEQLAGQWLAAGRGDRRALVRATRGRPDVAAVLKRKADARLGESAREAVRAGRAAAAAGRASGTPLGIAVGAHALAKSLHGAAAFRAALPHYLTAADLYRKLGRKIDAARVGVARFGALCMLGRDREAEALAARTLGDFRRLSDPLGTGKMLVNLASLRHQQDRHADALRLLARARPLVAQAGDALVLAGIDLNRANSFSMLARFADSARGYDNARAGYLALGLSGQVAVVDYNRAYDFFLQGRFHDCRRLLAEARAVFRREGLRHALALAALDEAEIALALGLGARAVEAAVEARAAFARSEASIPFARATLLLAAAQREIGQQAAAALCFAESRREFRRARHPGGLAAIELALASDAERSASRRLLHARAAWRAFTALGMRAAAAMARVLWGTILLEQGACARARRELAAGLRAARALGLAEVEIRAQHALARLAEGDGKLRSALSRYQAAAVAYERLRSGMRSDEDRLAFATDKAILFEDAVRVALDLDRPDLAFDFVERVRSRALIDLLGADPRFTALRAREGGELGRRLARLKAKLLTLEARARDHERRSSGATPELSREIRRVVFAHEEARHRLAAHAPELAFAREGLPLATIDEMRELLGDDRALLVWFRDGQSLGVIIVADREVRAVRGLAALGEVQRALGALRMALAACGRSPGRALAHRDALLAGALGPLEALHRLLLAPIERTLADRSLVVIPTAALHDVPFQALSRGGRALIESREVTSVPSASVLLCAARRRPRSRQRVVVSCADAAAPGIADEGRRVARVLEGQWLDGSAATAAAVCAAAPGAHVLHIAAHGVFEPLEPLLSGLELHGGRLTLPEIAGLPLDAALVVLSACESALGLHRGDEVQGLVRSFLHAGSRSVVASQWAVNDEATSIWMERFHQGIVGGLGVGAAHQRASIDLKRGRSHPFYWAPFQVMGCWDGLNPGVSKPHQSGA